MRQDQVGGAFLVQSRLKKLHDLVKLECFGKRLGGPVAGDFEVLHPLGGRDECEVLDDGFALFRDGFGSFFHQAFHGLADFSLGRHPEDGRDLVQRFDVPFGFIRVRLEGSLKGAAEAARAILGSAFTSLFSVL